MVPARRAGAIVAALASLLMTACGTSGMETERVRYPTAVPAETTLLPAPLGLGERDVDLRAGPVAAPITLQVPAIGLDVEILAVGISPNDVMDAPGGPADARAWQQAFWYRGSAVPGQTSTALIAGHVNDPLGRDGVFARLEDLAPGDEITVHDTRTGLDVRFAVTTTQTYTLTESAEPEVLRSMYGDGPVDGRWPVASDDGLAHLVLVTCAGSYRGTTHDHRLMVKAVRIP